MKFNPSSFALSAKKSLGQNFLSNPYYVQKMLDAVLEVASFMEGFQPTIHEIGPGTGALTMPLLKSGCFVHALEKDARAIEGLQKTLGLTYPNQLELVETDILKWQPVHSKPVVCVGNIPYYITSDILLWFCKNKKYYTHGFLMVQNEVADRLQSKPNSKDYGRLTVKMQLNFKIEKLFVVPASCFTPKPNVDSAVIKLTPLDFSFASLEEESSFERFTALLFSARRKMLRKTLSERVANTNKDLFWQKMNELGVFAENQARCRLSYKHFVYV